MMDSVFLTIASAGGMGGQGQGGAGLVSFVPMIIIFAIFYFMLIRPQQRKEKERRLMIDNVKSGARIVFSGGIIGTITNVKESTFIVKIAENVKVEIVRAAVSKVLEKGEKAAEDKE